MAYDRVVTECLGGNQLFFPTTSTTVVISLLLLYTPPFIRSFQIRSSTVQVFLFWKSSPFRFNLDTFIHFCETTTNTPPLTKFRMSAYDDEHDLPPVLSHSARTSLGTTAVTRTVGIIKTHALNHRFEIERRIQEASFEVRVIVKLFYFS